MADEIYQNEEMLVLDKTDVRVPPDRREQLERLEDERWEELRENAGVKSAKFKREQAKSRQLNEARSGIDELLATIEVPAKGIGLVPVEPTVPTGKRAPPAPPVQDGPYSRLLDVQPDEEDSDEEEDYDGNGNRVLQFNVPSQTSTAPPDVPAVTLRSRPGRFQLQGRVLNIGFDQVESKIDLNGEGESISLAGAPLEDSSSDSAGPKRQQTLMQVPMKAARNASKAALALAAELDGLSMDTAPKPSADAKRPETRQRQKSVSEQVDGPRVSTRELNKPTAALPRSAWLVDGSSGVDRVKFEKWVSGGMDGDFLMRESGSSNGFVLCVNDFGSVVNYPIEVEAELDEDGDATSDEVFKFMGLEFYSLEDVVAHVRTTPLKSRTRSGEKVHIGFPAIRESWYSSSRNATRELEAAVKKGSHACFAVRKSSTGDKYVLVVNDCGDVCSYSITRAGNKWEFGETAHASIEQVIEHVKKNPFLSKNTPKLKLGSPAM